MMLMSATHHESAHPDNRIVMTANFCNLEDSPSTQLEGSGAGLASELANYPTFRRELPTYLKQAAARSPGFDHEVGGVSQSSPSSTLPIELQNVLSSICARSFAFDMELEEVHLSKPISELMRVLESKSYVLVRKSGEGLVRCTSDGAHPSSFEVILSRMAILQATMNCDSLERPLASVIERVSVVEAVVGSETLDRVFARMLSSGREEICVMDQGVVRGVITCQALVAFIQHHHQHAKGRARALAKSTSVFNSSLLRKHRDFERAESAGTGVGRGLTESPSFSSTFSDEESIEVRTKQESRADRCVCDTFSPRQLDAQRFCTSWCCELLVALLVVLDVSIGIADLSSEDHNIATEAKALAATCCILSVFLFERVLRTYGFWLELPYHPFWVLDCVIVDASVVVAVLVLADVLAKESKATVTMIRVLRMLRIFLIVRNFNVSRSLRRAVSSQKTRYRKDGFDLDLTYINEVCIAMSLPAHGAEAHYRNPMSEVQRFFAAKHRGHFLIFNLCRERDYDPELFDGRVVKIDVEDHNPPRLSQIIAFLERAGGFMEEDPLNCIAVHCKGGKGRTGIMISAWLMYSQFRRTADDAMGWFAQLRTGARARVAQGVSQPSQQRYVRYVERVIASGGYFTPSIVLRRIVMKTCPRVDTDGGCNPWFTIEENGRVVYDYREHSNSYIQMHSDQPELSLDVSLRLEGDVRVIFFDHDDAYSVPELCGLRTRRYPEADDLCFFFWFHTGFVTEERTVLGKADVDVACHDHKCKVFSDAFAIELHFDGIPPPDGGGGGVADDVGGGKPSRGPFRPLAAPSQALLDQTRALSLLDQLWHLKLGASAAHVSADLRRTPPPSPPAPGSPRAGPVEISCAAGARV